MFCFVEPITLVEVLEEYIDYENFKKKNHWYHFVKKQFSLEREAKKCF